MNAASDNGNVLLRDNRIVIPASLRDRIITIAQQGHQGVVRTKQLLREKIWFPGIEYKRVEEKVSECIPCQAATSNTKREPIAMSQLLSQPWKEISIDFCDLPTGEHLLVIIDDYTRFPVVEIVTSTSSQAVVPHLDCVFALFGVPEVVRTDNGPPFNSHYFAQFAKYLGFNHRRVTPHWPQANGEVERFMRVLA